MATKITIADLFPGDKGDRHLAAVTFGDNLKLLLVASFAAATCSSENLKPLHHLIGLGARRKPCNRHMSEPRSGTTSTIS
ncbi:hypothetical protein ADU59_09000 [Pararhizobium polonicum]|uniref:Uncharacterized protein n=1 Tax=Pararhizobium polonicum TaxID=1612624 RepID=A0A1C7P2R1_9HYPH|nr:hypothetical protein [Pararhizobium polonicum]OBZ95537.1 hypothetical protein ADU59_09000 [Pararhizobium polonicum]